MYAGLLNPEEYAEDAWKMAIGQMEILPGLNMAWNLTDGLTKKQFKERFLRNAGLWQPKHYITKSGRIIIPELNIY